MKIVHHFGEKTRKATCDKADVKLGKFSFTREESKVFEISDVLLAT